MYKKISDYGIIGNSRTLALVGNDGSIDWLCLPYMDSPSVFAALLDEKKGGRFSVQPIEHWDSATRYLPGTNILQTMFRTRSGMMQLTDFMPVSFTSVSRQTETDAGSERSQIYRFVAATRGELAVEAVFDPRFDYARQPTSLRTNGGDIIAEGGNDALFLSANHGKWTIQGDGAKAVWHLKEGNRLWLRLQHGNGGARPLREEQAEALLKETETYWRDWLDKNETGKDLDLGHFKPMIDRSALVLKLLEFKPSGAIAAAATTSLPEAIGGVRNWDYRFSWIRDSALTVDALYNVGHLTEMESYLHWMETVIRRSGSHPRILYGLRDNAKLVEEELSHLEGYKGSAPVRIGNGAYDQKQLDIYGEIMDAALRLSNYVGKIDFSLWPFLQKICDTVVKVWQTRDFGIWEVRGGPYHFVYSKIMCWTALDRGITIAKRYGFPADVDRWARHRQRIREEILDKGWNEAKKAFVQHYETDALDASNLLIPFYGFLSYDDPRMISTVEAIRAELTDEEGLVYRYTAEDGLPGSEGVFLVCSFWLADNFIGQHRFEAAQNLLSRLGSTANHLGLFPEEYDTRWREALGNFPQAFTHIGCINSLVSLSKTKARLQNAPSDKPLIQKIEQKVLIARKYLLNRGSPAGSPDSPDIAKDLKRLMNTLRGGYFRTAEGRIAYEEMADSRVYREYVNCTFHLDQLDLSSLTARNERLAFWINLFNVLVIHGVIALGIRDSVKEIPQFFRRIQYRVDGMCFTPDDIEHGILRSNHRLPHSVFKPFGRGDSRRRFVIGEVDPRIHFALVCASSSCPPIDIYTAENLDEALTVSGKTFLNAGGIQVDRERRKVRLSRVFKWYGEDFGKTEAERLRFIAPYLHDESDQLFLKEKADLVQVDYQPYDWRLNRR
ncbi:MAG: glycoside hydrolase family 15 protein [Desulfobacterales bacterium]